LSFNGEPESFPVIVVFEDISGSDSAGRPIGFLAGYRLIHSVDDEGSLRDF